MDIFSGKYPLHTLKINKSPSKFGSQLVKQSDDIIGKYKDIKSFVSGGVPDDFMDNRKKYFDRDNPYPQILDD